MRGRCSVWVKGKKISVLQRSQCFGETALLRKQPQMATVACDTACSVMLLDSFSFAHAMALAPDLRAALEATIAERIHEVERIEKGGEP